MTVIKKSFLVAVLPFALALVMSRSLEAQALRYYRFTQRHGNLHVLFLGGAALFATAAGVFFRRAPPST